MMHKIIALMMLMSFLAPGIILGRLRMKPQFGAYQLIFALYFLFFLVVGIYIKVFYDVLDPRR